MLKKTVLTIIDVVSTMIIVLAIAMLLVVVMTKKGEAPDVGGYSAFRVLTGSMAPEYPVDCMVVVKRQGIDKINVGDVISFYSGDEDISGMVNTHRVISEEVIDGQRVLHTKGDANPIPDDAIVTDDLLIGKVIFKSVFIGKLVRLAANPIIFIPFIVVPLAIMLIANVLDTIRATKELTQEEMAETKKLKEEPAETEKLKEELAETRAKLREELREEH